MANPLTSLPVCIKAGSTVTDWIDLTSYSLRGIDMLRRPEGAYLMPLVKPREAEATELGGGDFDAHHVVATEPEGWLAVRLVGGPIPEGMQVDDATREAASTPCYVVLDDAYHDLPWMVLMSTDESGNGVEQAEDTWLYLVCEIRR